MKKFYKLFVLLFLLSLCCIINKSYADVVLSRWDEGIRFIKITLPYPPYTQNYMVNWAGTMLGTVDGDTSAFYFSQIQPKNGMLINYPYRDSGSVNGKMYYILKKYIDVHMHAQVGRIECACSPRPLPFHKIEIEPPVVPSKKTIDMTSCGRILSLPRVSVAPVVRLRKQHCLTNSRS